MTATTPASDVSAAMVAAVTHSMDMMLTDVVRPGDDHSKELHAIVSKARDDLQQALVREKRRRVAVANAGKTKPWGLPMVLWFMLLEYLSLGDLLSLERASWCFRRGVLAYVHGWPGTRSLRDRMLPADLKNTCLGTAWPPYATAPWSLGHKPELVAFETDVWKKHAQGRVMSPLHFFYGFWNQANLTFEINLLTCTWGNLRTLLATEVRRCISYASRLASDVRFVVPAGYVRSGGVVIPADQDDQRVVLHPTWKHQVHRLDFVWLPVLAKGFNTSVHVHYHPEDGALRACVVPVSTLEDMKCIDLVRMAAIELEVFLTDFGNVPMIGDDMQWNAPVKLLMERHGSAFCIAYGQLGWNGGGLCLYSRQGGCPVP